METAWCTVGVSTNATVAHVYFQGENLHGNADGELDIAAMARCS
jgi:hypothetical protein